MRARLARGCDGGAVPGVDRLVTYAVPHVFSPARARRLTVRGNPAAGDLVRHAVDDVPGNANLARSWAKAARSWPPEARSELLDPTRQLEMPVLLLWADRDRVYPLSSPKRRCACSRRAAARAPRPAS